MNEPNTDGRSRLEAYIYYVPEGGIDLSQFVEQGGCLVGQERIGEMHHDLAEIQAKVSALRDQNPRLARRLEFFEKIVAAKPDGIPEKARNEIVFALLYAAAEADLIPDVIPEIGYSDDAAITELVLWRHADFFERYCAAHQIEWAGLKSELS
jgi:uncharacterized membrane protein YkvA (DUF1232 family)